MPHYNHAVFVVCVACGCCCGCLILLLAIVGIYMIIIGKNSCCNGMACLHLMYIGIIADDCPVQNNIKIYVIVQGSLSLLFLLSCGILACAYNYDKKNTCFSTTLCCGCGTTILLLFIWAIIGSVWVWGALHEWTNDNSECNSVLFVSALACLSLHYMMVLLTVCSCTCYCCAALWKRYSN